MTRNEPEPSNRKKALTIYAVHIKQAALLVRAVDHPVRQRMLKTIAWADEMQVTTLYQQLHLSQGAASMHLQVLRQARVVTTRKEGKKIWYAVRGTGCGSL